MKTYRKKTLLIFVLSIILLSCGKQKTTISLYPNKDFYKFDSIYPYKYLKVSNYKSFKELKNDVEKTICNDSTAILEFKTSGTIKKIRLINFCFRGTHGNYKLRNTIEINNDTIIKSGKYYPFDSLFEIMNVDFNNYGKNREFSDNPKRLIFHISYPNLELKNMINTLNLITENSEKIGMNDFLHIKLSEFEKIEVIETPLPPDLDDIELEIVNNQELTKEQIGLKFINDYVEFIENKERTLSLTEWLDNSPYVSRNFKLKINKQIDAANKIDKEFGLGFDPILNAQDYPEKGFEFLKTENEYVEFNGINWTNFILKVKMIKENDKFKVDNTVLKR